jgi:hypothetical protein
MQARIVSAADGARWLAAGWRLFRTAPLGWLSATLAYWFAMTLLSLVPLVGAALAVALVPAFTVGFMSLARSADGGGGVELRLLFDGFRHAPRAQLVLGLVYLAAFAAVLGASVAADGGLLARWVLGGRHPAADAQDAEAVLGGAGVAALAYLPVMLAFWFAPPLVAWHSAGALKALFFSLFACLMNWRALLAYGALVALATVAAPLVLLNALVLGGGEGAKLAAPLLSALLVVVLPILFASFYASYRDVFGYHLPQ